MGGTATRLKGTTKSQNSNGRTITLYAEFCSSWGFNSSSNQIVKLLVTELNKEGYDVNYTIEPLNGGNGEYYIYKVSDDGTKNIVFSNNKNLHGSKGALIGGGIRSSNVQDIVKKIIS